MSEEERTVRQRGGELEMGKEHEDRRQEKKSQEEGSRVPHFANQHLGALSL